MVKISYFVFVLLLLLFSGLNLPHAGAEDKPVYVFFTCDVESTSKGNPQKDIWGKGDNEYWGISKIMDILDKHNIKGTFFVNVYEEKQFGGDELAKICQGIDKRGHDVELHTHPQYAFSGVYGMQDVDLAKQIEIIRYGKSRIHEWTGRQVVAHRAGAYAANENTLKACLENDIHIDSSRNYAYAKHQGLSNEPGQINKFEVNSDPRKNEVFFEIPVTNYYQFKIDGLAIPRILDIESTSLAEFRKVFQEAARSKAGTIVIMSHSFSFTRYNRRVRISLEKKFNALLMLINETSELEPITFEKFLRLHASNWQDLQNGQFIPVTGIFAAYLKSWERLEQGKLNPIIAFSPIFTLIFGLGIFKGAKKCLRK